jgi:glycosyltransferase involved in cell wall biosynthesis
VAEPFVSVIVPVHNAERALPRLIASLRAQRFRRERFEMILVDNRSTDRSREVMSGFSNVTALSQTARQGPAATRNEGIRAARGDVLAFIDADCWAHPDWLDRGVRTLMEKNLDRVAGRVEFVLSPHPNIYELYDSSVNFRQPDFLKAGWCGTGNLFVRRSVFDEIGLFDGELISHEDSEWGLRATRAGKSLGYAPEAVVYHRARTSLASLARKWIRTEYGAAQLWRRHGLFELHLWTKKANYRPLIGTWQNFPPAVRENPHLRATMDAISNILRLAGNLGSFLGYFNLGRRAGP